MYIWVLSFIIGTYGAQQATDISIDSLYIRSDIRHRYAVTLINSQITNKADFAQDVQFEVQLPKDAFISDFSMQIDGVDYPGQINRKAAADRVFQQAVNKGQSAGKVATKSIRDSNEFIVSVNVKAASVVTFDLTYQELLQRKTGLYEHVIYINPGVIVPDFQVEVFINESRAITQLTVPEIRDDSLTSSVISGTNKYATMDSQTPTTAKVTFSPTVQQQQDYSESGVSGQFIVNYDVEHTLTPEGEILASDGYFVHFFAPEDLPPLGKRIVFVLDKSGSMQGTKINQLREAMLFILDQLRPIDEFGIVLFSSTVETWGSQELVPASHENLERAKTFIRRIRANGGTNINDAVRSGLNILQQHNTKLSMAIFLTDGKATSGITQSDQILKNIAEARLERQSIYSLAFGQGADFDLLQKISSQNRGFARKIFEDADASLQLAGFYNEISTPLLTDVLISYLNDTVDKESLTVTYYPWYFHGSEIVVCGRYYRPSPGQPETIGVSITGKKEVNALSIRSYPPITYYPCCYWPRPIWYPRRPPIQGRNDFIERLWVYLTVKQLLVDITEEPGSTQAKTAETKVTNLALKYSFVTPYTSMTVTTTRFTPNLYYGKPLPPRPIPRAIQSGLPNMGRKVSSRELRVAGPGPSGRVRGAFKPPRRLSVLGVPGIRPSFPVAPQPIPNSPTAPKAVPKVPGIRPSFPVAPQPIPNSPTAPKAVPKDPPSGLNVEVRAQRNQTGSILCMDLPTGSFNSSRDVTVLNDTDNGVLVTGVLHATNYGDFLKFIEVRMTINNTLSVRVSTRDITLGSKSYRWFQVSSLRMDGLRVTGNNGLEFTTAGNLIITLHKYGLETRRSLSSPYITATVTNTDQLSADATGLLALGNKNIHLTSQVQVEFLQNGIQQRSTVTSDKTVEGESCYRVKDTNKLGAILG